jgi:site-specific recombinase XerD
MEIANPSAPITHDNIHLSQPIERSSQPASGAVCNPLSLQSCTDPKILELIAAATASNTRRAYEHDLAHFLAWGGAVPGTSEAVAAYIAAHAKTLSAATLARRIVAIRRAHALQGFPDPTKAELVRLTVRGIRRLHGRPQPRVAPLKVEHLFGIASVLGGSIRDARDRALLFIGFASAFRRSELTAINCDWVKWSKQGIEITLPRSKTDQQGVGRSVVIPRVGGPICPVTALEGWLQKAEITDGSLFRRVDKSGKVLRSPLSPSAVATIVKQRVGQIGLDPRNFSGHSLRAGFATCAAAAGLSAWTSSARPGMFRMPSSAAIFGRPTTSGAWRQFGPTIRMSVNSAVDRQPICCDDDRVIEVGPERLDNDTGRAHFETAQSDRVNCHYGHAKNSGG